ncbi:MAG: Ig-like domain-containing protein, partial [Rhizobacter sp.]
LDGSTWVDATITSGSTWVANGITLQNGSHDLYVRAINLAGNTTTPATHAYTLESAVISATALINGVWDDAGVNGSSTGLVGSGLSTDDNTPTISGTISQALASGQVVALYDNGTRLGTATVNGTSWTYAFSTPVATGTNNLTAVIESPASGAHSATSNTYLLAHQTLTLGVFDDVGGQHGAINLGGATDDNLPHFAGTLGHAVLGAGEVIAVYDGSVRIGTATINGTSWSFDPVTPFIDGQHTLRAVIQDSASTSLADGRVIGDVIQFIVDTAALAPTQTVTISAVADDSTLRGSLSGNVSNGTSTDDRTPTLTGSISATLGANQVVVVYDTVNGVTTRMGEAIVTGTAWSFTTSTLAAGTHAFTAVAESAASGAQGTVSNVFTVREQSVTVTAIEDNVGIDVGGLLHLSLTDDDTPTMKGTIATSLGSGEVVAIYDGATRIGNATVTGTNWVFTPSVPLNDGVHSLVAMVQDDATGTVLTGRVISESTQITVLTLLSTPSQAVVITAASENNAANGSATGTFASGTSTDGTTPTLTGTINANLGLAEVLAVYDGGTRIGLASVNGTNWSFTTSTLSLGSHSFTARVENLVSGATGSSSSAYVVIEQSITASALTDDVGSTQGTIAANGVTDDSRPSYSGTLGSATLGAGEVVSIYDGSTKLGNATVNGTSWTFTPAGALADGSHSLRAVVQDSAASSPTGARLSTAGSSFTVNTSAVVPTQTTSITGVADDVGTLTGNLVNNTSTDDTTPTLSGSISGSLDAGQTVAIYDGSTRLGYASVNGTSWTYTTSALAVGSHSLTAVVENQATGAQGPVSSAFVVQEQSVGIDNLLGITGAVQVLVGGLLNVVLGTNPGFTGTLGSATLGANEVVAIYDGSTKIGNATVNGTHWGFTPTSPLSTGFHQITAAVQDAGSTNLATARVSSSVANLTVDLGLLVPTQFVTIDWAIESSATNGSVTGQFASGTSTDGTTPSIGGSVSASLTGAQVIAVYDGATKLGNATVTGQSWSYTTTTLTPGSHNLSARVENPSTGSAGPSSGTFVVLEQSISAITVTDDVGAITGSVAQGGFTDDKRPTFSGTLGSAGLGLLETVAIYDTVNGVTVKLGDAVVNGSNWSFTPIFLAPMADGAHSIKAVVQPLLSLNSAGTVVSPAYNFTIDSSTTPLQILSLGSVTDTLALGGSIIGAVLNGGTTDDTRPTLNGTLSAGLTGAQAIAVYDNGLKIGYANVDATNPLKFSYTPGSDLSAGT